ncbi:dkgA [Symbiodinium pilosum]|uniref:DkgA protein n=1 Tax=Symbiodinium pilosum TaxID=2952 RepID=A0A812TSG9_SYMPI|nr:dkgA [Symbiodinium pilosum]
MAVKGSTKGMPILGYIACCLERDLNSSNVRPAVARYLTAGGRHVMTAPGYGNEQAIGQGIRDSGIPREEIWVTTALDPHGVPADNIREWAAAQIDSSLQRLNVDYADDIYLHWGVAVTRQNRPELANVTEEMNLELYRGLLDAQTAGKIRHIGVGLHTQRELEYLINSTGVMPEIMYAWITPFMPEKQIAYAMWARSQGMALFGWGPFNWQRLDEPAELEAHRSITNELADKYNTTPLRIILRWYLDLGIAMATSMLKPSWLEEDLNCLRTPLTAEDRARLESVKWGCHKTDQIQPLPGCMDA